jgi:phenylacetate-CoA ligase
METLSVEQPKQPFDDFSAYMRHESWTRQQVASYQAQALHACRQYAYAHSPFYQHFHHGLMQRPLQQLPVLTKAMLMEQFDDLVTDRALHLSEVQQYLARADASSLLLDRYRVMATSGSSGQPGIFLYNRAEDIIEGNSFIRCQYWGGVTPTSKAAVVSTGAQPPMEIDGKSVPRLNLSASDPPHILVRRLNEWQPEVLVGHASIVSVLADEQHRGRLHIAPSKIFCAADTLTSEMRRRIEEIWQTKLFNVYGTTEGGALAAECEWHQGLHLFEDFSIVEIVDEHLRPVPPGQQGDKVLLTVLFRRTQPLIRYEISDLVRRSSLHRCPCGRPFALLEAIEGRTTEMIYLPSLTGGEEEVHPFLFEIVLDELPVNGYQVVHEEEGLHIFLTGAAEELRDEHVRDVLQAELNKREVIIPPIEIHRVRELNRNVNGKTPKVISHVPRHASNGRNA